MKIVELTIDDVEGFIEAIALVERPAHESNFFWFKSDETPKQIYEVLDEEQMSELAFAISQLGESFEQMDEDGYFLYKIEDALPTPELFYSSEPNPAGENEYNPRVRYAYSGPSPAGRVFCKEMLRANRLYTESDLLLLSDLNPVGPGGYSVLNWRGSYNCRHKFKKLTFLPKVEGGKLINKSTANRRQIVSEETGVLYDTRTTDTIASASRGTRANGSPSTQWHPGEPRVGGFSQDFSLVSVIDDIPVFSSEEDANIFASIIGCEGSHKHILNDGTEGWMPCSAEDMSEGEKVSFDYHDTLNTDKGMELAKKEIESGSILYIISAAQDDSDMTTRAEELGIPKSRIYATGSNTKKVEKVKELGIVRHYDNNEDVIKELGSVGVNFSKSNFSDCSCKDGYVSDGNSCIPIDNTKMLFSTNEDKMEITGAAMIPNKLILRREESPFGQGQFYYVFFTEQTIRNLAEKFMESKLLDSTNIEHIGSQKADTYVKESWIVEDPDRDKSAALGLSYPKGTWVITSKVKNPVVWEKIKKGVLNGYSVEGWFSENLLFR